MDFIWIPIETNKLKKTYIKQLGSINTDEMINDMKKSLLTALGYDDGIVILF